MANMQANRPARQAFDPAESGHKELLGDLAHLHLGHVSAISLPRKSRPLFIRLSDQAAPAPIGQISGAALRCEGG